MRTSSTRLRIGGALAATSLSVLVGLGGTAFAEPETAVDQRSDRTSDVAAPATEDNDSNDGSTANNVVDAGDNQQPSGNDRSVENGGSGNQGNATSEPDLNTTGPERNVGGVDQPGNPGGVDLADQDGNNGCGNDDDFEDDNEGLCGPKKPTPPTPIVPSPETPIDTTPIESTPIESTPINPAPSNPAVVNAVIAPSTQPQVNPVAQDTPSIPTQVLGVSVERPAAAATVASPSPTAVASAFANPTVSPSPVAAGEVRGAALARTGFGTPTLVLVALSLLLAGFAMVRRPKGVHFTA